MTNDVDIAISAMANFWTLIININVAESLRYVFCIYTIIYIFNCINFPQHLFPKKLELLIKLFNIYFLV